MLLLLSLWLIDFGGYITEYMYMYTMDLDIELCIMILRTRKKHCLDGRGVARGGGGGVHMSPGAKVQGRQNEAYKTFTRVKTIVDYVNYL